MTTPTRTLSLALLAASLAAPACSSSSDEAAPGKQPWKPAKPGVFQEAIDQGAARYVGMADISDQTTDEQGITTYTFDPATGPMCLLGDPYSMAVRDTGSEGLFIFLQGGGACWSTFCLAITKAAPGIPQTLDILDPTKATNPLASWSTVYLPYCDGSLFAGDSEHDDTGDGKIDRYQHGLQNLSAALDVARAKFPSPKRVVLAGSSGGGYGTILATILVRAIYPDSDLLVFDDAGVGLGKPGDLSFITKIVDEFNVRSMLPASCKDCIADGNITRLVDWELAHDPSLKISAFSGETDFVISDIFFGIDAATFKTSLLDVTSALHAKYPDRYERFFVASDVHTTLLGKIDGLVGSSLGAVKLPPGMASKLGNVKLGGIDNQVIGTLSSGAWFKAMIDGTAAWADTTE